MCLNCFPYARPNDQYDKPRQCIEKQKHHFANKGRIVKAMIFPVKVKSVSRVRLCDPMDCSLSGSSVHGIFQARVLEWIAIFLLQGIFPTQESNLGLLHCRQTLYRLSYQGSPVVFPVVMYKCESWTIKKAER